MPSAAVSQGVSGAASGAATGAAIGAAGGPIGAVGGAIIGGIGGLISGASADSQQKNRAAWAEYNRQSQYNTDVANIQSGLMIAGVNAGLAMATGRFNARNILNSAMYNAQMIRMTTAYNNELLDNELVRTWNDLGLDIHQIEMFRARERGDIEANQGASGTVMGEGSNAAVIIDQGAQEAMDINIVQFGADRKAANITNEMAQGLWQGEVAAQQTIWEGEVGAATTMNNARVQAFGGMATATLQAGAGMYNAKQALVTGGYNIDQANAEQSAVNKQSMIAGLFQAGSTAASSYYANKAVVPKTSTYKGPLSPTYQYNSGAGSSLMTQGLA